VKIEIDKKTIDNLNRMFKNIEYAVAKEIVLKASKEATEVLKATTIDTINSMDLLYTTDMRESLVVRKLRTKRHSDYVGHNVQHDTEKFPKLVKKTKSNKRYFYPAVVEFGSDRVPAKHPKRIAMEKAKNAVQTKFVEVSRAELKKIK